jgi:3-oxoadipate enol-lactonase
VSPVALHHRVDGPADGPPVVLAPSLGTTLEMWDGLARSLADTYRVIRLDTRGHGGSPVPEGSYTTGDLAADVVALADTFGLDTFAFVGLSLGGAIGQTLALDHPDRLSGLVLCCTGPSFGEPAAWRDRAARVRSEGMGFLVEPTKERWFTPGFRASEPAVVDRLVGMLADTPPVGYAGCCDALAAYDVSIRLGQITAPTRVICGAQDPVSPLRDARVLVEGIPDADLVVIEQASHIANLAQPERFNAAVREHLDKVGYN